MRPDRATDVLFALSSAVAFFGFVLSPLWLLFTPAVGLALLPAYLLVDILTMYRVLRGHFRLPGHFIPLLYYTVFCVFGIRRDAHLVHREYWLLALIALALFHVSCQYLIPAAVTRSTRRRRGGGSSIQA